MPVFSILPCVVALIPNDLILPRLQLKDLRGNASLDGPDLARHWFIQEFETVGTISAGSKPVRGRRKRLEMPGDQPSERFSARKRRQWGKRDKPEGKRDGMTVPWVRRLALGLGGSPELSQLASNL